MADRRDFVISAVLQLHALDLHGKDSAGECDRHLWASNLQIADAKVLIGGQTLCPASQRSNQQSATSNLRLRVLSLLPQLVQHAAQILRQLTRELHAATI